MKLIIYLMMPRNIDEPDEHEGLLADGVHSAMFRSNPQCLLMVKLRMSVVNFVSQLGCLLTTFGAGRVKPGCHTSPKTA